MDDVKKAYCGGCNSDIPLNVGLNDAAINMDREIAHYVYGIPEDVIDAWPFGIPQFSTTRRWSFHALERVAFKYESAFPSKLEAVLLEEVWRECKVRPVEGGLLLFLSALSPYTICKAVLAIARSPEYQGYASMHDARPQSIRRAFLPEAVHETR